MVCVCEEGVFELGCEGQDLKGVQPSMKTALTSRMNVQMCVARKGPGWLVGRTDPALT